MNQILEKITQEVINKEIMSLEELNKYKSEFLLLIEKEKNNIQLSNNLLSQYTNNNHILKYIKIYRFLGWLSLNFWSLIFIYYVKK